MARFDQYIGLNNWSRMTVHRREKVRMTGVMTFSDGRKRNFSYWGRVPSTKSSRTIGVVRGAWDPIVADLKEYTLQDGRVLQEFVQAAPWHGGPNYFIALKDAATGHPVFESLWSDEEIR